MTTGQILFWAYLAYVLIWIPIIWWVNRWPIWLGLTPGSLIVMLFVRFAAGWLLPDVIRDAVYRWKGVMGWGKEANRLVRFIGGCGSAYVAARGHLVWMGLGGLAVAGSIVVNVLMSVLR
jgi:hypothetical protein